MQHMARVRGCKHGATEREAAQMVQIAGATGLPARDGGGRGSAADGADSGGAGVTSPRQRRERGEAAQI